MSYAKVVVVNNPHGQSLPGVERAFLPFLADQDIQHLSFIFQFSTPLQYHFFIRPLSSIIHRLPSMIIVRLSILNSAGRYTSLISALGSPISGEW